MNYLDIVRRVIAEVESQPAQEPNPQHAVEAVLEGHAVLLCSDLLGDEIWIVSDEEGARKLVEQGERRGSIYTKDEIRAVALIEDSEIVREVHRIKRTFDTGKLHCERVPFDDTHRRHVDETETWDISRGKAT